VRRLERILATGTPSSGARAALRGAHLPRPQVQVAPRHTCPPERHRGGVAGGARENRRPVRAISPPGRNGDRQGDTPFLQWTHYCIDPE